MSDRLQTFSRILNFASAHQIRLNRFWGSFIETARFKLGESIKDIKIPFSFDSESVEIFDEAIADLVSFIKRRVEARFKAPDDRSIEDFSTQVKLPPRLFNIRFHRTGSLERTIIENCLYTDHLLDAGLFETWFHQDNSGQRLIATLQGIISQSLVEEIKAEHLEKTGYITHLALINQLGRSKNLLKKERIKGVKYEQIDVTIANVLYQTYNTLLITIINDLQSRRRADVLEATFLLLASTCHPLTFTSIKQSIVGSPINPYNISQNLVELLDPLYRDISEKDTDLNFVNNMLNKKISSSSKTKKSVLEEGTLIFIRHAILDFLYSYDSQNFHLAQTFREFVSDSNTLLEFLSDGKKLDKLANEIRSYVKLGSKEEERSEKLFNIEGFLRFIQKGSYPKRKTLPQEIIEQIVRNYLGYKIDLYLDQFTREAVNLMDNRYEELEVSQLKKNYENGKLYRISPDNHPVLNEFVEKQEGQLFIDLKDFTKRTHYSKEIVMADFLRTEFYQPILEAAQHHHNRFDTTSRPFRLVNLLGDAVIFSGSIESLVYLAKDIQNLFNEYRKKLKANSPINLENEIKERLNYNYQTNLAKTRDALSFTDGKIQHLQSEVATRIQSNFKTFEGEFPQRLAQELAQLEAEFLKVDSQINQQNDLALRFDYASKRNTIIQRITYMRGLQKQYVREFTQMSQEEKTVMLGQFYCQDWVSEIASLQESTLALRKREQTLKYGYDRELQKIEGFGMDAGLFISYGSAAEDVIIQDQVWGKQEVSIAETINESARGTARNTSIKEMLDSRLAEEVRLRSQKELSYPYHVFVQKFYSLRLPPRQNADFNDAVKNHSLPKAEAILNHLFQEGLQEARELVKESDAQVESRMLASAVDIYNEGQAMSDAALNAFLRETATTRYNLRKSYPIRNFHRQILDQFVFIDELFQFVLSVDLEDPKRDPLIFRYAGDLIFRGFEDRRPTKIYELIKFDSPFYQAIIRFHLPDWLSEAEQQSP